MSRWARFTRLTLRRTAMSGSRSQSGTVYPSRGSKRLRSPDEGQKSAPSSVAKVRINPCTYAPPHTLLQSPDRDAVKKILTYSSPPSAGVLRHGGVLLALSAHDGSITTYRRPSPAQARWLGNSARERPRALP
jgi:hypothetical protein